MRRAFTLIELLIVIFLIAVLVGLLFPATCKVKRAAARVNCQNNLRQLGAGAHAYHDWNGHFPPGTAPGTNLPPDERLSVYAVLLPYLEQEAVHKKLSPTAAWDADANRAAVAGGGNESRVFRCPDWINTRGPAAGVDAATGHLAVTNYVGVAGVGPDAAARPGGAPGVGVFGHDRTLKTADVKDGLADTLLAIETGHEVGPWLRGGPATVRPVDPAVGQLTGDGLPFGGTHFRDRNLVRPVRPDGFNLLLADGSVRYAKNEVHPDVLVALATVAGGEAVPAGW